MADPLNRCRDRLPIQDAARAEHHVQTESIMQFLLDDLQLHGAHQLHMHLTQPLLPDHMQQGILVLQFAQRGDDLVQGQVVECRRERHCGLRVGFGVLRLLAIRFGSLFRLRRNCRGRARSGGAFGERV